MLMCSCILSSALVASITSARSLLFGFQLLFAFVLWTVFTVVSLARLLLSFYLLEMSIPLCHVFSILSHSCNAFGAGDGIYSVYMVPCTKGY